MVALQQRAAARTKMLGNKIKDAARQTLEQNELFRGRSGLIRIDEQDGVLTLEGRLPSYYLKQMLQTVLRDVDGVKKIENRVAVDRPQPN